MTRKKEIRRRSEEGSKMIDEFVNALRLTTLLMLLTLQGLNSPMTTKKEKKKKNLIVSFHITIYHHFLTSNNLH